MVHHLQHEALVPTTPNPSLGLDLIDSQSSYLLLSNLSIQSSKTSVNHVDLDLLLLWQLRRLRDALSSTHGLVLSFINSTRLEVDKVKPKGLF